MLFKELNKQGLRILEDDTDVYLFDPETTHILMVLLNTDGIYASPYDMFEAMNIRTADFDNDEAFAKAVRERFDGLMEIFKNDTDFMLYGTETQPANTKDLLLPTDMWEIVYDW